MKFRTEIESAPLGCTIGYENRILMLGSCFAENIGRRLAEAKFRTAINPTGILFNPLSIAAAIRDFNREVQPEELHHDGQRWFHFGFHGDFAADTAEKALDLMNAARRTASEALKTADRMVLTLGTAWIYEREGEVVANCHRRPASEFTRRRASVGEITATLGSLIENELQGREVILTVSPVRHLGDTLAGNSVSKATLRLAAEEIADLYPSVHYFPAYDIVCDELRDYRFYADDLTHPSSQAVEYVWERFAEAALSVRAKELLPQVERIVATLSHRPRNPRSEAHLSLCRRTIAEMERLPEIDFGQEVDFLRNFVKNV